MTEESLGMMINENWPYAFGFFLATIVCVIVAARLRWDRITKPYKANIKISHHDEYDGKSIEIDGRNFSNLMIVPTEKGLYIAHYNIWAFVFGMRKVLIPWQSLSDIYQKKISVLGFTGVEHFVDTRNSSSRVQLQIPRDIAEEILNRGFLKSSVEKS